MRKENNSTWRYYQYALLPNTSPHIQPDLNELNNKSIWKAENGKKPLFARWTSDFDMESETSWWYVIKDGPFDASKLKSKLRYTVNKGKTNFDVRLINPSEYKKELYDVTEAAYLDYPAKYRPNINREDFYRQIENWTTVFGAFFRETDRLCGFTWVEEQQDYIDLVTHKADPAYEKYQINAALIAGFLEHYNDRLSKQFYVCNGERNILHETNFDDYLEKYFGFRKAYCKLNIRYSPKIKWIVKMLYPFRGLLLKLDSNGLVHNINGVLKMENIARNTSEIKV